MQVPGSIPSISIWIWTGKTLTQEPLLLVQVNNIDLESSVVEERKRIVLKFNNNARTGAALLQGTALRQKDRWNAWEQHISFPRCTCAHARTHRVVHHKQIVFCQRDQLEGTGPGPGTQLMIALQLIVWRPHAPSGPEARGA